MKKLFLIASLFLILSANAQHWDTLRGGMGDWDVRVMYADTVDNYLYAAGMFHHVDGKHCKGIARWNGTQWDSLGAGIDGLNPNVFPGNTLAMTRYNNELYVGGGFGSAGNVPTGCLAKWNGSSWDSLPVRPFPPTAVASVWALAAFNGKLYMGGDFNTVAGISCEGIAQWDGVNWSSINFPVFQNSPHINAITEYNGELYAAGNFCHVIGDTVSNILRWDGNNWHSVGGGVKGGWTGIASMAVYNGELYVAGAFFQADGNKSDNIQKWNGTSWSSAGGGTGGANGQIAQIFVCNGKLYAVGNFTLAGGIPANYIASWDDTNWCSVGATFDNVIESECVYEDTLFIGGGFQTINGDSILHIAKWIGGNYTDTCGFLSTGMNEQAQQSFSINIFPNPANDFVTIQFENTNAENLELKILNVFGQTVRAVDAGKTYGAGSYIFDLANIASGVYFIQAQYNGQIISKKFIKQ